MKHLEKETLEIIQRTKEKRRQLLKKLQSLSPKKNTKKQNKTHKKAS